MADPSALPPAPPEESRSKAQRDPLFMRSVSVPAYPFFATCAGAGLDLMANMAPSAFPQAPHLLFSIIFWTGAILTLVPFPTWGMWLLFTQRLGRSPRAATALTALSLVAILLVGYYALGPTLSRWSTPPGLPVVTGCLVDPKRPALVLVNSSNVVAEQIKHSYVLFDLDSSNPNEPLHIPVGMFDFIKPQEAGGPQNIFDSIVGPSVVKDGDRIVGSIAISCPKCAIGRSYLVSITLGATTGWFTPIEGKISGWLETPPISADPTKPFFSAVGFLPILEKVPHDKRISIVDQRTYFTRGKSLADCPLRAP
jgi:hypothetical protein